MITSKRNGFLTASFLILLLCFAVTGGTLTLAVSQDLSVNSISWFDREFIAGKEQLGLIADQVNADLRFPDHLHLKTYLLLNGKLSLPCGRSTLTYVNSMSDPSGAVRLRFTLSESVSGRIYERPVTAEETPDGKTAFRLDGISY